MKKLNSIVLVVGGIALGCGASAVAPVQFLHAAPQAGSWQCYKPFKFPKVESAMAHEEAIDATDSMNQIAGHVPAGTVTTFNIGATDVLCIKH